MRVNDDAPSSASTVSGAAARSASPLDHASRRACAGSASGTHITFYTGSPLASRWQSLDGRGETQRSPARAARAVAPRRRRRSAARRRTRRCRARAVTTDGDKNEQENARTTTGACGSNERTRNEINGRSASAAVRVGGRWSAHLERAHRPLPRRRGRHVRRRGRAPGGGGGGLGVAKGGLVEVELAQPRRVQQRRREADLAAPGRARRRRWGTHESTAHFMFWSQGESVRSRDPASRLLSTYHLLLSSVMIHSPHWIRVDSWLRSAFAGFASSRGSGCWEG